MKVALQVEFQSLVELASLLAAGSYLALGGDSAARGDGLIPVQTSALAGATNVVLSASDKGKGKGKGKDSNDEGGAVYHSNFIGPLVVRGLPWYGSDEVVDRWVQYI